MGERGCVQRVVKHKPASASEREHLGRPESRQRGARVLGLSSRGRAVPAASLGDCGGAGEAEPARDAAELPRDSCRKLGEALHAVLSAKG